MRIILDFGARLLENVKSAIRSLIAVSHSYLTEKLNAICQNRSRKVSSPTAQANLLLKPSELGFSKLNHSKCDVINF